MNTAIDNNYSRSRICPQSEIVYLCGIMPLYRRWQEPDGSEVAIWKIEEPEAFFVAATGLESDRKQAHRRLEYLAGRYLLRQLAPGLTLKDICLAEGGKPFHPAYPIHFSITHSYPYVAAAIHSRQAIGMDIQLFVPKIIGLQHKFLSAAEQEFTHDDVSRVTLAWTAKEAAFKWFGAGQVDFIKHMPITQMQLNRDKALLKMSFLRSQPGQDLVLPGGIEADFAWSLTTGS